MVFIMVVGIAAVIIFWGIATFNRLIRLRNHVKNSWSQIDVQLQRRYDLIPNLVETAKGYMAHEKGTFESVTKMRNQAMAAQEALAKIGGPTGGSMKELMKAETALKGALGSIFALSENYPELRASENMQKLQEELSSTENKVAFSRQAYNDQAMSYNTSQQQFPATLVAGPFGHRVVDLYEVDEKAAKKSVKVSF